MNPHEILLLPKARIKLTFIGVLAIAFFYTVFQPFQMAKYEMNDFLFVNGAYLILTFIILSLHLIVFPIYFKTEYLKSIAKKQNRLFFLVWIAFAIGISFFLFKIAFGYYEFTVERMLTGGLAFVALAAFPVLFLRVVDREEIDNTTPAIQISAKVGQINIEDVLYIYSDKNYIVWVCSINEEIKEFKVRETFKSVKKRVQHQHELVQTHRAFLVNISKVDRVYKNSGSYTVSLKKHERNIPLSRGFYADFPKF
jgi:hypothetical protein